MLQLLLLLIRSGVFPRCSAVTHTFHCRMPSVSRILDLWGLAMANVHVCFHSVISQIHVMSGIGMPDHRVVTLRLYYWPAHPSELPAAVETEARDELEAFVRNPSIWTYDFGPRWLPVQDIRPVGDLSIASLGHVVYSVTDRLVAQGQERLELSVQPFLAVPCALNAMLTLTRAHT